MANCTPSRTIVNVPASPTSLSMFKKPEVYLSGHALDRPVERVRAPGYLFSDSLASKKMVLCKSEVRVHRQRLACEKASIEA
jgi:hypothetical protein